jgi:hypothetical protein
MLKGRMSGDVQFQQHRDASCHQLFFMKGKVPKETHVIMTETLGEHALSYVTVKNWMAQFKSGDFSYGLIFFSKIIQNENFADFGI